MAPTVPSTWHQVTPHSTKQGRISLPAYVSPGPRTCPAPASPAPAPPHPQLVTSCSAAAPSTPAVLSVGSLETATSALPANLLKMQIPGPLTHWIINSRDNICQCSHTSFQWFWWRQSWWATAQQSSPLSSQAPCSQLAAVRSYLLPCYTPHPVTPILSWRNTPAVWNSPVRFPFITYDHAEQTTNIFVSQSSHFSISCSVF